MVSRSQSPGARRPGRFLISGAMSALSLPLFALMVGTFLFPINGTIGIIVSVLFVGVSAAGLLYHLNQVMHVMNTSMVWPAAYHIALGVLVILAAWLLILVYVRWANRHYDTALAALRRDSDAQ